MDGSHPYVLKECSREMAVPLHYIYKKSLEEEWKQAKVVPIYKKGSKIKASNYRPISLTSMPCKVMESLIRDTILSHLTDKDLLSTEQHGFVPRRSCMSNLLVTLEDITMNLDNGSGVDVIYLDYS